MTYKERLYTLDSAWQAVSPLFRSTIKLWYLDKDRIHADLPDTVAETVAVWGNGQIVDRFIVHYPFFVDDTVYNACEIRKPNMTEGPEYVEEFLRDFFKTLVDTNAEIKGLNSCVWDYRLDVLKLNPPLELEDPPHESEIETGRTVPLKTYKPNGNIFDLNRGVGEFLDTFGDWPVIVCVLVRKKPMGNN